MTAPREWFYFGCVRHAGHFLWTVHLEMARKPDRAGPWDTSSLDQPVGPTCLWHRDPRAWQLEGVAHLTHREGWTALSFADRSVDDRPGSHSDFLTNATLDGETMIAQARAAFPSLWERFPFSVRVLP